MSKSRNATTVIKYLTFDEMMLRVAEMRAARRDTLASKPEPPPQPPLEKSTLFFPDYISHCELWCIEDDDSIEAPIVKPKALLPETGGRIVEITPRRESRRLPPPVAAGPERYAFAAATLMIAVLLVAGTVVRPDKGGPSALSMMAAHQRSLVAGSPAWEEITSDDALEAPAARNPPRRESPRISPEHLEDEVRDLLASNGFPDIGVSASRRGEVYLAGQVFSPNEVDSIVRIAHLAEHARRVFFLHPEVREPQGAAFLGAVAEYAPGVWGARISFVIIGSPAYKAGLRIGDVIREFDHAAVSSAADLNRAVAEHKPGARVSIRIWREGAIRYRIARLTPLPQFASR